MGNRLLNNVGRSCLQTPTTTQQFEWHLHDSHGQTLLLWVQGTLHVCCHTVQFNQLCDKRVKHGVATICRVVSTCEDRGFSLGKPIKEMSWKVSWGICKTVSWYFSSSKSRMSERCSYPKSL